MSNELLRDLLAPNPLFERRVPEAAAQQLATVLAWLTECQLATWEQMLERSRVSNTDLKRQESICVDAVRHCYELGVTPIGLFGERCLRLSDRLAAMAASGAPR